MNMYGMMFGQNPASDVILATMGLTKADVGRFRDVGVEHTPDRDPEYRIAVYTRNGGGNRHCDCADGGWGDDGDTPWASHESDTQKRRQFAVKPDDVQPDDVLLGSAEDVWADDWRLRNVRGKVIVDRLRPVCEQTDSPACSCTGCVATHRLPQHPLYLFDRDDEFDCTYATFYFRLPDEFADPLRQVAGGVRDTDQAWQDAIAALSHDDEALERFRPLVDAIAEAVSPAEAPGG